MPTSSGVSGWEPLMRSAAADAAATRAGQEFTVLAEVNLSAADPLLSVLISAGRADGVRRIAGDLAGKPPDRTDEFG